LGVTEILPPLLRQCAAEYEEMCAFLGETLDKASFQAGYLAHAAWCAEHERSSRMPVLPVMDAVRGVALPIAS
jgi:hypothetical protein